MFSCYSLYFKFRVLFYCNFEWYCSCGRKKEDNIDCCVNCVQSMEIVLCVQNKEFFLKVFDILNFVKCSICKNQFVDEVILVLYLVFYGF